MNFAAKIIRPPVVQLFIFGIAIGSVGALLLLSEVNAQAQAKLSAKLAQDDPVGFTPSEKKAMSYQKPSESELRQSLSPEQYRVTQQCGTEPAFNNAYWNNKEAGIYVDTVSGEPLFSSLDKFDSGTGWPSFTRAIQGKKLQRKDDPGPYGKRVELRSPGADSHLGHVFQDGPAPGGERYCINSAALRFVPLASMQAEGYGQFLHLFQDGDDAEVQSNTNQEQQIILAAGCFWGVEEILRKLDGVKDTEVGYIGGAVDNPGYGDVKTGRSGHAESVRVSYDPSQLSTAALLDVFFRLHDPTTLNRQGHDVGTQYRSAIFYTTEAQRIAAVQAKQRAQNSGRWKNPVTTEIVAAKQFYLAESYHQDYLEKNPGGYSCHYLRD